jgi:uncharacterized RmlC-like cupin family protein
MLGSVFIQNLDHDDPGSGHLLYYPGDIPHHSIDSDNEPCSAQQAELASRTSHMFLSQTVEILP